MHWPLWSALLWTALLWSALLRLMPYQLLWLVAREADECRLGPDRTAVTEKTRYPKQVRQSLASTAGLPAGCAELTGDSSPAEWHSAMLALDRCAVALAVVMPLWKADPTRYLSPAQKSVREFWLSTKYMEHPVMFMEFCAIKMLAHPISVRAAGKNSAPMAMFFEATVFSGQALEQGTDVDGQPMSQIVDQWAQRWPAIQVWRPLCICWSMQSPHAMLCSSSCWPSYGFPFINTSKGLGANGMRFIANTLRHALLGPVAPVQQDGHEVPRVSLQHVDELADILRRNLDVLPAADLALATEHLTSLQHLYDAMVRNACLQSRYVYEMSYMLRCLVMGGYLKNAADLSEALSHALQVVVNNPDMFHFFKSMINTSKVPSPTSMYRHRLTLHQGFCRYLGQVQRRMLSNRGGIARWATLDSSPQGGYDWLLSGSTVMKAADLIACFRMANELIELGGGLESERSQARQRAITEVLHPK